VAQIKEPVISLIHAVEDTGLKMNEDRTKYVITGKNTISSSIISAGCYNFRKVESFVYLWTMVNYEGYVMMEIKARLGAENRKELGSKLLPRKVKGKTRR
jgi:hypothetical protein